MTIASRIIRKRIPINCNVMVMVSQPDGHFKSNYFQSSSNFIGYKIQLPFCGNTPESQKRSSWH